MARSRRPWLSRDRLVRLRVFSSFVIFGSVIWVRGELFFSLNLCARRVPVFVVCSRSYALPQLLGGGVWVRASLARCACNVALVASGVVRCLGTVGSVSAVKTGW